MKIDKRRSFSYHLVERRIIYPYMPHGLVVCRVAFFDYFVLNFSEDGTSGGFIFRGGSIIDR